MPGSLLPVIFQKCLYSEWAIWIRTWFWGRIFYSFAKREMGKSKPENTIFTSHSLCLWWTQSQVQGLQAWCLFSDNLSAWNSKNTIIGTVSFKDLYVLQSCHSHRIRKGKRKRKMEACVGCWRVGAFPDNSSILMVVIYNSCFGNLQLVS